MSPNEKHTKVIQELFDSKVLGTSQNPTKEIQKLKDLVNLQYEYDTGNAPSAAQTTKQSPSVSKQSTATRRQTSTSIAPSSSKQSTATRPPTSTSGKQSSRDPVQDLFTDRARNIETNKKGKEAAEKVKQKIEKQSTTTRPPTSTSGKHTSRDPVQDLFTDRARKLETEKKEKEAAEKAERKAKALAKKEATSLQQAAAISQQEKYAKEEKEKMAEEKMAKERVLKKIEADKVERKEREERRKEAARVEADEASRGSLFNRPKEAYTTRTMPRSISSRPNPTFLGQTHPSNIRLAGSQVPPRGRSLASRPSTAETSRGERLDGEPADEEYADDEGYSDEEHLDQGYSGQGYTPRNNNNQKPSQRRPPPRSVTREDNPANQGYASPHLPRSSSSRPSGCPGIRLGGPQGSSYTPLTSSLPYRPRQRPRAFIPLSPRAGLCARHSRPSPQPGGNNMIEDFDMHESAKERPQWSREMDKICVHPSVILANCSHCDRGRTSVCMPCVVRGCKGQWCEDCWDAMVARKRAMGPRVTRPPGWQECPYRSKQDLCGLVHSPGLALRPC